jgi:uncharacterized protein with beta-barrel porin domain
MFEHFCDDHGSARRLKRHLLNSSCLLTAFLAVPATLPVGVLLARPAQAQTSLGNSSNEVILNGAGSNPFSVGSGITIDVASNDGIYGDTTRAWTLSNAGTVRSGGAEGVNLKSANSTLTNLGGGLIYGAANGAELGTGAVVANSGTIECATSDGGSYGILLDGTGTVSNNAGGTITGYFSGIWATGAASVSNAGLINDTSPGSGAVVLTAGGTVSNLGSGGITGESDGIDIKGSAGFVANAGTVTAADTAIYLYDGGGVTNAVSGHITGAGIGVISNAADASLVNAGSIIGTSDDGVLLNLGGGVTNAVGGYIKGGEEGLAVGYDHNTGANAAAIQNSGVIAGGDTAVILYGLDGGQVTNLAGGTLSGGGVGVGEFGTTASVTNSGLIEGSEFTGIFFANGDITNTAGGTISGHYGVIINHTGSLTNSGLIDGTQGGVFVYTGNVTNNAGGTISGGVQGVYLYKAGDGLTNSGLVTASAGIAVDSKYGATVVNQAGGSILGAVGYEGIRIGYANNTGSNAGIVQNSGSIYGGSGVTMYGHGGGTLSNLAGGSITGGGFGVLIGDGVGSVDNAGYIHADSYYAVAINDGQVSNESTGTLTGGGGVDINDTGTLINRGLIAGGNGARLGSGSVINNATGSIIGTQFGVYLSAGAGSLSNAGLINGGTASADIGAYMKYGGSVLNQASGHIGGAIAVQIGYRNDSFTGTGLVENQGVIAGGSFGVDLFNTDGGSVGNAAGATISGGEAGIYAAVASSSISNSGTITGGSTGVDMEGGVLTNAAGGLIEGGGAGLFVNGSAQISNAGTIRDTAGAGAILNGAATLTNSGTVSGVTGLILSGENAAVVNSGVIASTQAGGDAIRVTALDPAQITLTGGSALTGAIDGGGTDGQIVLQGSNQMGNDIVNFGTGSALEIASGANWIATGNWTIANVTNDGAFQPGVLGTPLMLTGNFTQDAAGTMQVIVTPTVSSQFIITGNATLAGGIKYVFAPGIYTAHVYDFLTATGTVTGNYTTVTYGGAAPTIFTRSTNTLANSANLVLAGSGSQNTGQAASTPVAGGPSAPQIVAVVAPEDGSLFSAEPQVLAEITQQDTGLLLGKAALGADAGSTACAAAAATSPLATSPNGTSQAGLFASIAARSVCGAGGWVSATGGVFNADASGGAPSYAANTAGFMAGIDRAVGNAGTRLGLAVGYDQVNLQDNLQGKLSSGVTRVGLYGSQPLGRFMLAGELSGGFANNTTTRQTGIGALQDSNSTDIVSGGLQVSTRFNLGPVMLTPATGIRFATVSSGGISETARGMLGAFAVSGDTPQYSSVQPYLSLQLSRQFSTGNGIAVTPVASLGYQAELADLGAASNVVADGTKFTTPYNNLDGNAALLGLGISAGKAAWSVYANYAAHVAGNWTEQTGEIGVQARF